MDRSVLFLCAVLLAACSGENDSVRGSDAQHALDDVSRKLDAAAIEAESRLDEALHERED